MIDSASRYWKPFLALTILAAVLVFVFAFSLSAATPAASTITVPSAAGATVVDSWTGTAATGVNPASDCAPVSTSPIDEHAVTINVPAGTYNTVNATFTFQINWTPASGDPANNDLILTVIGPDGQEVNTSDGGTPQETVAASNLAAGTYKVQVCGFINTTSQPYNGTLTIATTAGGTPPPVFIGSAGKGWVAPVKVTPTNGYGYEPTLLVDKYGNAFATAHKENATLGLALDPNSPDGVRSQSWMWWSVDKGQNWLNAPGLSALAVNDQEPGDEGDLAYDDAGHIYFVDTYLADITITRWTANGLGQVMYDFSRPIMPSPESDDRPWITAHGNGHVFYFSNDGSQAADGGRYTVHPSYDGGVTWDIPGKILPGSGWCRPAADHRAGSKLVYAACTDDGGKLYSYVSTDDGQTWSRYLIGTYNDGDETQSYPSIEVGKDGTVWMAYLDSNDIGEGGIPNTNQIYLFKSVDQGKTWTKQDVTPVRGRYQYIWLAVSPDGKKLGLGTYFRPNNTYPWVVAGVTWPAGGNVRAKDFLSLDPDHPVAAANRTEAPGDYLGSYFFPDGKFGVVWTRSVLYTDQATLLRDIYFIRQK
jgi:hypothetical protein